MTATSEHPDRQGLVAALVRATAPGRVSTSPPDRVAYARDLWPRGLLGVAAGDVAPLLPDAVVWPVSTVEVQAVVRLCAERAVPIVPFGAGSGVCGGTLALRGGVVVDVKRMRRLSVDARHLTLTCEAGILGDHLEHELGRRGFTLGHFPSSIMCSTLGGWLAARSAGQCSSRYGKIEDMVRSLEFVSGAGEVVDTEGVSGLDPLMVGSEGTLGIITRATLRLHPAPAARHLRGLRFDSVEAGGEAMRRLMQSGLRPSVVRLYDELDTALQRRRPAAADHGAPARGGGGPGLLARLGLPSTRALSGRVAAAALRRPRLLNRAVGVLGRQLGVGCRMVLGFEGEPGQAAAEAQAGLRLLEQAGGRDLGPGPGEAWLAHRYDVSFGLSKVFAAGAFADTMEVATTWGRLMPLYHAVRAAVAPHAFIMAHFSHAYEDGCSIYFTFAAAPAVTGGGGGGERAAAEARYDAIWRAGLGAASDVGATISHHHGVGLSKAGFMGREHGEGMRVLGALKRAFDPHGIMNPGKLGL